MTIRAKIISMARLRNTRNGNPRYALTLRTLHRDMFGRPDGEGELIHCTTKPDSSFAGELTFYGWMDRWIDATIVQRGLGHAYLVNARRDA